MVEEDKAFNPVALQSSVIDRPEQQGMAPPAGMESTLVWLVAAAADEMEPWGRKPKLRDYQLRQFFPTESLFSSALGMVIARNSAFSWYVEAATRTQTRIRRILEDCNFGRGWVDFIARLSMDLYTQDFGSFVEVVREPDSPTGGLVALNNLDAARCLTGQTQILLSNGKREWISNIVREKYSGPVVTIGPDGKITERKIVGWYENPLNNRSIYRIILNSSRNGRAKTKVRTWATEDHEFLTPDGWITAGTLKAGMAIVTPWPDPSPQQKEIVVGSLLGDGSLSRAQATSFGFSHSNKQKEWLDLKISAFEGFSRTYSNRKSDYQSAGVKATPAFNNWYDAWYEGTEEQKANTSHCAKKLRVPRELISEYFSPLMLSVWYGDDGSLDTRWGRNRLKAHLWTNAFPRDDVEWLSSFLCSQGIEAFAAKRKRGEEWYINITVEGFKVFSKLVAPYLPSCLRYKLPLEAEEFNRSLWNVEPARPFIDTVAEMRKSPSSSAPDNVYCIDVEETHNFVAGDAIVHNCWHTGDPETPVIYQDRKGRHHLLKWWQVLTFADMPTAVEGLYGLQICSLSRLLLAAQVTKSFSIYRYEKISGRHAKALHLVKGFNTAQLKDALTSMQANADARGFLRYVQPMMLGSHDPKAEVGHDTIELASMPDGFTEDTAFKHYIAQIAMAFLSDYQEFAPLPGGNLGTSSQSEVLHAKMRGKGPALFMKMITHALNSYVMPENVEFGFAEPDLEAESQEANVRLARARERKERLESFEITVEEARQMAADAGDLPQEMLTNDITPRIPPLRDIEQPHDTTGGTARGNQKSLWQRLRG